MSVLDGDKVLDHVRYVVAESHSHVVRAAFEGFGDRVRRGDFDPEQGIS